MLLYGTKFYEKTFKDASLEITKAYKKACSWYYKKVLSNKNLHDVKVNYVIDNEHATVTIELYCTLESNVVKDSHCRACKEYHWKVFENSFFNCNICNFIAVDKKYKEKINIKKSYYSDIINGINRADKTRNTKKEDLEKDNYID